jgi:hypothetical protein
MARTEYRSRTTTECHFATLNRYDGETNTRLVDLSAAEWGFRPGKQITCSMARWTKPGRKGIRTPLLDCETDEETALVVDAHEIDL